MNFTIRPWNENDLADLVFYAGNRNVSKNMTDQFPYPYTEDHGHNFITFARTSYPTQIFAIEVDIHAVGGIGIHPQTDIHKRNAELGYWLAEPYWGKGIMTAAVKQMTDYAFKTFDIDRLFARPFGTNLASQKVLENAGFTLEGRFKNTLIKEGIYLDELIYAIRRQHP